MSKAVPLPGITFAGTSYARNERVFETLPRNDARRLRHREVIQFRSATHPPEKPRWNMSVLDEAHPFPERPIMHSLQRFEGVDVSSRVFPQTVRGTKHLETKFRSPLWMSREGNRSSSNGDRPQRQRVGFLSRVIESDFSESKKKAREGWVASTMRWSFAGQIGEAEEARRSYVEVNKKKKGVLNMDTYLSPVFRVREMNERIREAKRSERMRKEQASLPPVGANGAPAVFKMSNIDEWWHLDPTLTVAGTTAAPAVNV
ncbi:hypothetical protein TraAM80_07635 [Trypanosoma rangeli]|uniref:Uncharacterized protein n=1 Tax=Trypanosoma rangeli TaxID=5698 RepID=A0A3R7KSA4_TRYRA|nr:uncharacterized protein TraAM80_07635 [Trypanosoma rangeli]RNF00377.1 hypothetical protein TraAM80_07635 [Trypanosoma rangeli]|eukprot:RNF00377.1 hypothetical protein TraAM80_07635 [Trypanosoma rangeli]